MEYASLVVMLALIEYLFFTGYCGAMRARHGVQAPATGGNEAFERAFRVQQNTLEQLIVFVPATYTFAFYFSDSWVFAPGAAFVLGRFLYWSEYMKDPASRGLGFGLTFLANVALIIGTLIGLYKALL